MHDGGPNGSDTLNFNCLKMPGIQREINASPNHPLTRITRTLRVKVLQTTSNRRTGDLISPVNGLHRGLQTIQYGLELSQVANGP